MTSLAAQAEPIVLDVLGEPRPKGSKSAIVRNGRAVVVESKSGEGRRMQAQWAADVRNAAQQWRDACPGPLLDAPLEMTIAFYLPRPKSAPRRVVYPATRPDWDKLARLVADSCKGVIYRDDALIVRCCVSKFFAVDRAPGATITIEVLP